MVNIDRCLDGIIRVDQLNYKRKRCQRESVLIDSESPSRVVNCELLYQFSNQPNSLEPTTSANSSTPCGAQKMCGVYELKCGAVYARAQKSALGLIVFRIIKIPASLRGTSWLSISRLASMTQTMRFGAERAPTDARGSTLCPYKILCNVLWTLRKRMTPDVCGRRDRAKVWCGCGFVSAKHPRMPRPTGTTVQTMDNVA